jgi:hypothetical protein
MNRGQTDTRSGDVIVNIQAAEELEELVCISGVEADAVV